MKEPGQSAINHGEINRSPSRPAQPSNQEQLMQVHGPVLSIEELVTTPEAELNAQALNNLDI